MLIRKDEGRVELSVSLAGTWSGSAGTAPVDCRKDLGHAGFWFPSCLSVPQHAAPWRRASVFLRRRSLSKSPSAEPMIASDKWRLLCVSSRISLSRGTAY